MGRPTEKMVQFLKGKGVANAESMSFEEASKLIGMLKGSVSKDTKPMDTAFSAYQKEPKTSSKPTYNPSSQYVSYSKDIFLALLQAFKTEKALAVMKNEVVMEEAINLVKQAIKEFE